METVLIFFLMALFGMAVMIVTLFCLVWVLLNFEVE
jgi:hypothetical protein